LYGARKLRKEKEILVYFKTGVGSTESDIYKNINVTNTHWLFLYCILRSANTATALA
jgi:hypothetical protein